MTYVLYGGAHHGKVVDTTCDYVSMQAREPDYALYRPHEKAPIHARPPIQYERFDYFFGEDLVSILSCFPDPAPELAFSTWWAAMMRQKP
jgi:hypothetical protein